MFFADALIMTEIGLIVSLQSVSSVISSTLSAAFHTEDGDAAPAGGQRLADGGQGSLLSGGQCESCDDVTHGGDPAGEPVAEDTDGGQVSRKKKHRRGKSKKRKWKPYNKLTWEEKRELEDRESRRAHRIRAERFAHGQPVAPYNTTQFLMEDHNVQEPDLVSVPNGHRQHRESTGTVDSDEYYSSPEDEEEFLQKEFCEVYDNIHAERLSSMTKLELIQEYIQLEDRVDKLEQRLGVAGRGGAANESDPAVTVENLEKIRIFHQELRRLAEENERLKRENEMLRCAREATARPGAGSQPDHFDKEQTVPETEIELRCDVDQGRRISMEHSLEDSDVGGEPEQDKGLVEVDETSQA